MITDFLRTNRSPSDLRTALEVLREFKSCESENERQSIPFSAWAKLEQLEEFLDHLVEGNPLHADTLEYIKRSDAARDAIASARIEGRSLTAETLDLIDQYVAGEITIEQVIEEVKKR